jgi:hypothetical protein
MSESICDRLKNARNAISEFDDVFYKVEGIILGLVDVLEEVREYADDCNVQERIDKALEVAKKAV